MRATAKSGKSCIRVARCASLLFALRDLVGPHLETDQRVRSEGLGDRNVGGIASLRDQDAADPRHVVAGIEGVPVPAEIGFEPAGEVAGGPGLWRAHVAEI